MFNDLLMSVGRFHVLFRVQMRVESSSEAAASGGESEASSLRRPNTPWQPTPVHHQDAGKKVGKNREK